MPVSESQLKAFRSILPAEEIIEPSDASFKSHSTPWSLSYDKHPELVLAPSSVEGVQAVLKLLCETDLDFAVRGRGVGSASASDVILSMKAFQNLTFDEDKEVVELGSGLDWGQVDERLATMAPGYAVVGARCPYVGVVGSTLHGGLSWLSHELGLGSDPTNMLDAQIVTTDGRLLWASQKPDLLWALRGGGGNFGVVTALRLKAHKYGSSIFSGMIFYPSSTVETISKRVAKWVKDCPDPKLAMHLFLFDFSSKSLHGEIVEPQLVGLIFDGHGEAHARSEKGFQWALDIEGAKEDLKEMPLSGVHELQRSQQQSHGTGNTWLSAPLVEDVDEGMLIRAWNWYAEIGKEYPDLVYGTFALLEVMQKPAMCSTPGPESTGWPHGAKGQQHVLQLSIGGVPITDEAEIRLREKKALELLGKAVPQITGKPNHPDSDYLPNFLLPHNDLPAVFGGNWDKLRQIKAVYDPKGRLDKDFFIPPAEKSLTSGH